MSAPAHATHHPPASFYADGQRISPPHFVQVATDPARSVVVQACAGSGKTHLLVQRMVRALAEPTTQADQIVALTFNTKAAAQIQERLNQVLQQDAHRHTYLRMLHSGRRPNICTLHSWFAQLVQAAPLAFKTQWGVPLQYELLLEAQALLPELTQAFYAQALTHAQIKADLASILAVHGHVQTLKALEDALKRRIEFELCEATLPIEQHVQHPQHLYPELHPAWEENTDRGWGECMLRRVRASGIALAALIDSLMAQPLRFCHTMAAGLDVAAQSGSLAHFDHALLTQSARPRVLPGTLPQDLRNALGQLQETLLHIHAARHQLQCWRYHQSMSRITRVWLKCYATLKARHALVDMQDLERWAWQLLSDPVLGPQVQERLDWRVRHVLIDEFQDTSTLQWQTLYSWLGSYAGAASKPSVFIVGDTRQGIYRFRSAEPRVFAAARDFLHEAFAAQLLQSNHTRRCSSAIVRFINETFGRVQAQGQYADFVAHTTERHGTEGEVVLLEQIAHDAQPTEAQRLCAWIAQRQGTHPAQHIMVLASRHEPLHALQQALSAQGIPAQKQERGALVEHPAVQDLIALLGALLVPANNLDLARVLKSPFFALDDHTLIALKLACCTDPAGDGREQGAWLDQLGAIGLPHIHAQLHKWQQWLHTWPPFDALEHIYADSQVLQRYQQHAPAHLRASSVAALQAVLAMALQVDSGRFLDAHKFLRALKNPVQTVRMPQAQETRQQMQEKMQQAAPQEAQEKEHGSERGSVTLATVHSAKGLEAEVVLVMDMDAPAPPGATMLSICEWPPSAIRPRRFIFVEREHSPPHEAQALLETEHRLAANEDINLLYVALTRAKEMLVLSSTATRRKNATGMWARVGGGAAAGAIAQGRGG